MNPIPEKLREKILGTKILYLVIAANLAGTAFGFYYYMPLFAETEISQWLLVADSPLATLALAVSLIFYRTDRSSTLIDVLAFVGNLKYGLWTTFVLAYYFETFWQINSTPMYLFLFTSHLAMALQAFLVLDYTEWSFKWFAVGGTWFFINDLADYFLRLHPRLYTEINYFWNPASIAAVILTISSVILYLRLVGQELPQLSDLLQRLR